MRQLIILCAAAAVRWAISIVTTRALGVGDTLGGGLTLMVYPALTNHDVTQGMW